MKTIADKWLQFWFASSDAKMYALVRIVFAVVALVNLADLWSLKEIMFSDRGVIHPGFANQVLREYHPGSVFYYFNSENEVKAVFVCAASFMVLLAAGCMSRLAVVAVYAWQLSYMNYNPLLLGGWDTILTIYSFILMISPLSSAWSLDMWMLKKFFNVNPADTVPRYGLNLMQFQAVIIYFSVVLIRFPGHYWQDGEFFSYFVLSAYFSFDGMALIKLPWLMVIMNYFVSFLELIIPILLFTRWKGIALAAGLVLHLFIALTTNIWLFQLAMMMVYIPFFRSPGALVKALKSPFSAH